MMKVMNYVSVVCFFYRLVVCCLFLFLIKKMNFLSVFFAVVCLPALCYNYYYG